MKAKRQILVTGLHEGWVAPEGAEYKFVEVLDFKALPVSKEILNQVVEKPFDWIIFTSSRAVQFWTEALLSEGLDFPIETRVACIGEATKVAAEMDGYTPDFYPTEPGSETFLKEFQSFLTNNQMVRILLPGSSLSRPLLKEELSKKGCDVTAVATYETVAKENLNLIVNEQTLKSADLFLFTGPTSVEAVCSKIQLPKVLKVGAIGDFTKDYLLKRGFTDVQTLKEGLC